VVALAGAGVAAVMPGILEVRAPYIRSGGALAVFISIMYFKPALISSAATFIPPPFPPDPAIQNFFTSVDSMKIEKARDLLDADARKGIGRDKELYYRIYATAHQAIGTAVSRMKIGVNEVTSPSGYPPGVYQIVTYTTRFSRRNECHQEVVTVRAVSKEEWRVFGHQISPGTIPCFE
jgi:hypothetical protein